MPNSGTLGDLLIGWIGDQFRSAFEPIGNAINEYAEAPNRAAEIQADAATEAARLQTDASDQAIAGYRDALDRAIAAQTGASDQAMDLYSDTTRNALTMLRDQYEQGRLDYAPYRETGLNALARLRDLQYQPFDESRFRASPGYGFRLDQGLKAIEQSALARGGMLSGNTLKEMQRYGQGLASDEYNNAFNRYQTEFSNRLLPLQYLTNMGSNAAGNSAQLSQGYGSNAAGTMMTGAGNIGSTLLGTAGNLGNLYMGGAGSIGNLLTGTAGNLGNLKLNTANARAAGLENSQQAKMSSYIAGMNLLSNLLGTGYNMWQGNNILNNLRPNQQPQYQQEPSKPINWNDLEDVLGRTTSYAD